MDASDIEQLLRRLVSVADESDKPLLAKIRRRCRNRKTRPESLQALLKDDAERKTITVLAELLKRQQKSERYGKHRAASAQRQAEESRKGREIGPLPPVEDPERKAACQRDLQLYLETYHAQSYPLDWSEDQLTAIRKLEHAVLVGALFALAMPRGSGKTTITRDATKWAALYGHSPFTMLTGPTDEKGEEALEQILADLETNPQLLADFPEVCYPLYRIEQIRNRARGQLLDGEPTRVRFGKRLLQLPSVQGSAASGAVIKTAGILSAVRGANHRMPDGSIIRPRLVISDDFQTRVSAESPDQCAKRLRIISGDLLGMAGPSASLSAVVPCTVIAPGDGAEQLLDRERHPEWRGERCRLLISFPDNMDLWEEYDEIRRRHLIEDGDARATPKQATAFYRKHRKRMDKGARVSWEARYRDDEISALQHAMNWFFRDEAAFWTEAQNEPRVAGSEETFLDAAGVLQKTNNYQRGQVPADAQYITAMIDVGKRVLHYVVCAWEQDFTGYVIEYGTWPEPARTHWTKARFRPTLMETYRGQGAEAAIYSGLQHLTQQICGDWRREDGVVLKCAYCLIDQQWSTSLVQKFCRESTDRGIVLPQVSRFIGPNEITISNYRRRTGERIGTEWLLKRGGRNLQLFHSDANHWKTITQRLLATAAGDPGALTIFGRESAKRRANHELFSRQLTSEHRQRVSGQRTCDVWQQRPNVDNDWFDCLWGCAVAASLAGASLDGVQQQQRRRMSLKQMQRRRRKEAA